VGNLAGGHWKYAEWIGTEATIRPVGLRSGVGSGLMGQSVGPAPKTGVGSKPQHGCWDQPVYRLFQEHAQLVWVIDDNVNAE
jgi:hypothetical protein